MLHVPLSELLADGVFREERWGIPPQDRPIYFFEVVGDTIWGATGAMLRNLLAIVTGTFDPDEPILHWPSARHPHPGRHPGRLIAGERYRSAMPQLIFEAETHAELVTQVRRWLATSEAADEGRISVSDAVTQGAGLTKDALRIVAQPRPPPCPRTSW